MVVTISWRRIGGLSGWYDVIILLRTKLSFLYEGCWCSRVYARVFGVNGGMFYSTVDINSFIWFLGVRLFEYSYLYGKNKSIMVTIGQLVRIGRRPPRGVSNRQPQRRARVLSFVHLAPRKPNSARRKVLHVMYGRRRRMYIKLTGGGNYPAKFAIVLACGGGYRDTPRVK